MVISQLFSSATFYLPLLNSSASNGCPYRSQHPRDHRRCVLVGPGQLPRPPFPSQSQSLFVNLLPLSSDRIANNFIADTTDHYQLQATQHHRAATLNDVSLGMCRRPAWSIQHLVQLQHCIADTASDSHGAESHYLGAMFPLRRCKILFLGSCGA